MTINASVLIYAINRTDKWWQFIANNCNFSKHVVVSDIRGAGDRNIVDAFNEAYWCQYRYNDVQTLVFREAEIKEIIARCRLLRWLPPKQARSMVAAMERAFFDVLEDVRPDIVVSLPIDRYVSDVLERLAFKKGIPYVELTASPFSEKSMLMRRGQLLKVNTSPSDTIIQDQIRTITNPSFVPQYVKNTVQYTYHRWFRIFFYFKLRAIVFKVISWVKRDLRSLHYLDAQSFLAHKPRLSDLQTLTLIDRNWLSTVEQFPKSRRIFFGLQVFPEAAIDYWLPEIDLIDYENLVLKAALAFSKKGYLIVVKDHPSQFGFRQHEFIKRLKSIPNVIFLPYEVTGNEVLNLVGNNFTFTGTTGLQAALLGLTSVVGPAYYTTKDDFIIFNNANEIEELPLRCSSWKGGKNHVKRQHRIISGLLEGSFHGDYMSFQQFDKKKNVKKAKLLAENLGVQLNIIIQSNTS